MYNITEEQAKELARLHRLEKHKELVKQLEEEANYGSNIQGIEVQAP